MNTECMKHMTALHATPNTFTVSTLLLSTIKKKNGAFMLLALKPQIAKEQPQPLFLELPFPYKGYLSVLWVISSCIGALKN